jgi:hypothetical protein
MSNEGISANQDKSMAQLLDAGETEISGFLRAVTQLFVAEKERTEAKSWIDELERMDCPGGSSVIDWRKITIAAAARLVGHGKDKVSRTAMVLRARSKQVELQGFTAIPQEKRSRSEPGMSSRVQRRYSTGVTKRRAARGGG